MSTRTITTAERDESLTRLHELLHPGDTVYTTVTHVAPSGLTRWIKLVVIADGEPLDISWPTARVLGRRVNSRNHEGVECGGAGMDMGFEVVYALSRALFRDGFDCLRYVVTDGELVDVYMDTGNRAFYCPSNDHANRVDPASLIQHGKVRHTGDGGYALNQRWL